MLQSLMILIFLFASNDNPKFPDYFEDKGLRIDLHQFGTYDSEQFCIHELRQIPFYAGPLKNLINNNNLGGYCFKLFDAKSKVLIYSRGFNNLFCEWKTTQEAIDGVYRVFEHTLIAPFPKRDVILTLSLREKDNSFKEIFRQKILMDKRHIHTDFPAEKLKTHKLVYGGDPHKKVDVLILGDGYSKKEMGKYLKDAKAAAGHLLSVNPMERNKKKFNIWAVETPSMDSGVDEPRVEKYRSTAFGTTFNTFDLAHYSMTTKIKDIHDAASAVPYDFIIIIFNSPRYGGGGIFNLYAMVTGHNGGDQGVIAHEFGHTFAGLADEYFNSPVSYIDFYPKGVEPWEPNITSLLDPNNLKWADLVSPDTPIPTPLDNKYRDRVGCFEGAGYKRKGLYRPKRDCIMHTCRSGFCPVCSESIQKQIDFYSDQ